MKTEKPKTLEAPPTLAGEINHTAVELLQKITGAYANNSLVDPKDYGVMVQACTKLMKISLTIQRNEIDKLKI